jgi:hypothetical protein
MGALSTALGIFTAAMPVLISCLNTAGGGHGNKGLEQVREKERQGILDTAGLTICQRFNPPPGYARKVTDSSSFGFYLRHLPLKIFGNPVRYYDGRPVNKRNVYISVIDMDIGSRNLQQCADAIMRLRAEFLYASQRYRDIHFNFVADGQPRYYEEFNEGDHGYQKFRAYLDYVFASANTRSLSQELVRVDNLADMQIGDVFIQTGNPYGHAIIVVDLAENTRTGEKACILAQSYMPAQDIHVLINRENAEISPWYLLGEGPVETPEWTFLPEDLKRFGN